ncbi:hypothetical protein CR513_41529, partial [Mucuna pruriens]
MLVILGEAPLTKAIKNVDLLTMPSWVNIINTLVAVASTVHLTLKIYLEEVDIVTIGGNQITTQSCYRKSLKMSKLNLTTRPPPNIDNSQHTAHNRIQHHNGQP